MSKAEVPQTGWNKVSKILGAAVDAYNDENSLHGELDFYPVEEDLTRESAIYEFSRKDEDESYLLRVEQNMEQGFLVPDLRNEFNMPGNLYRKIVRHTCIAVDEEYY